MKGAESRKDVRTGAGAGRRGKLANRNSDACLCPFSFFLFFALLSFNVFKK
jgi:hypothetical protein